MRKYKPAKNVNIFKERNPQILLVQCNLSTGFRLAILYKTFFIGNGSS